MTATQEKSYRAIHQLNPVNIVKGINGQPRIQYVYARFGQPNVDEDLHREFFSAKTYFMRDAGYPIKGIPVNYQHGMTKEYGAFGYGIVDLVDETDIGILTESVLRTREQYIEMLQELGRKRDMLISDGQLRRKAELIVKAIDELITTPLQHSGGFDPSTWIVNKETGHIDQAGAIHSALTPSPADDKNPQILRVKSMMSEGFNLEHERQTFDMKPSIQPATATKEVNQEPKESDADTVERGDGNTQNNNDNISPIEQGTKTMTLEEMLGLLKQLEEAMTSFGTEAGASEDDAMAMADETTEEIQAMDEEELKGITPEELASKAFDILNQKIEAHRQKTVALQNAFANKAQEYAIRNARSESQTTGSDQRPNARPRISVSESLKYAHLSATDMAMAWKMLVAAEGKSPRGFAGKRATDYASEEFYRHAMHKMVNLAEKSTFRRPEDAIFVKSALPFKANELDATDITGQGLEYLGNVYDTMVWETARNNQIYQLMLNRGMLEKPVPQGMKNTVVPVEGNDPTVYGGVEGNSTDSTGRPEVVYKITPQTTSTVTVTPGTFRTATAFTFELDEDSFVDMASEANRKVRLTLEEHIEKAMINADTETAASTNINAIGGAVTSTGLTRDYFLEFDGLRKSPLVTSTAYARDGGALAIDDYRRTWALLGSTQAPRKENIFFLIDFDTFQASLDLLPKLTKDVAGEDNSLFTGNFDSLWGLPVYMSGFLGLSDANGKVDRDTPGNNTKGQIMAVYAPYWAFVFKRNITIEMQRSPESESFEFYGSMRFALKRRSASAAAISYNLTV